MKGGGPGSTDLEEALFGLVVDEQDDAGAAGFDELEERSAHVGGGRVVVDPPKRVVARVRDDADHGLVIHGRVRLRGSRMTPTAPPHTVLSGISGSPPRAFVVEPSLLVLARGRKGGAACSGKEGACQIHTTAGGEGMEPRAVGAAET